MKHWPEDITLLGDYVRIDPLSVNHLNDLQDAVRDGENPGSDPKEPTPIARSTQNSRIAKSHF